MKIASLKRDQVWSATPTPFTRDGQVDVAAIHRLVAHHLELGVTGIMIAGTCGEGPWLRDRDREVLVRTAVEAGKGKLALAQQVTDNSAGRVLDNIEQSAKWGVEIAVVASPAFFLNATPQRLANHYSEIARRSPLPMGLYDRGGASPYVLPEAQLGELLREPNIVMVKDSAQQEARRKAYVRARDARPELMLYSGSEFDCVDFLSAGYDGLLLGGGIFNGALARKIIAAVRARDLDLANKLQARMNDLMYRVYGGPKIECWMTGLKELLVQLGVFSTNYNLLQYPLTEQCRAQITAAVNGSDGLGFREDLIMRRTAA
jgi:4-hydroxy-tetrahydrodipicolinate synthase